MLQRITLKRSSHIGAGAGKSLIAGFYTAIGFATMPAIITLIQNVNTTEMGKVGFHESIKQAVFCLSGGELKLKRELAGGGMGGGMGMPGMGRGGPGAAPAGN